MELIPFRHPGLSRFLDRRRLRCGVHGVTLLEMVIGLTISGIAVLAIAGLLKSMSGLVTSENNLTQAQEEVRQSLDKIETALIHANQVTIASTTFVQFTCD